MRKTGFTLAEVLITIGVVGVVAALTIPTLIQKYQERVTVTRVKKAFSILSQAYRAAKEEYGDPSGWYNNDGWYTRENNNTFLDIFARYIKTSKICYEDTGCWPDGEEKYIDGTDGWNWNRWIWVSKMSGLDGFDYAFYSYGNHSSDKGTGSLSEVYGAIIVNVNGQKDPITFGKDVFSFLLTKDDIVPCGSINSKDKDQFSKGCNRTSCSAEQCEDCAAWVIYKGNMDYLHCDDLSWDGKSSCK
jgi:prepilin-type N-terminal cleavage/methylation domain-containing protein